MNVAGKIYTNSGNGPVLARVPSGARVVLDVGCGAGDNARALHALGCLVDGITLSEQEAVLARPACRAVHIFNLEQGLPEGLAGDYDCALCSHVLEHICWPELLLADLHKKLAQKTGCLIIALPNVFYYRQRWQLLRGRFDYAESGLMDNTHFRWYSLDSARQLLEKNQFQVLDAIGEGNFPQWPLRRLWPSVAKRIDRLATAKFPGLFAWQLLLIARPRV